MQTALKPRLTAREYLLQERKAEVKSEFLDGEVFAMAGGTRRHSRIGLKLATALENRLAGKPCEVFNSDMRLKIEATELYAYPDIQVACGELRFEDEVQDTLLNPKIIVEVLSESTAAWDRGEKFGHYRHLESLAEYLMVSQEAWQIEHYVRQPDGSWRFETVEGEGGVLSLPSLKCKIPLTEIYAKTGLPPNAQFPRTQPKRKPKIP
jgi:Uma2 family endonuclease